MRTYQHSLRSLLSKSIILLAGVVLAGAGTVVLAWTGPSATPPNSNVSAPLNVSSTAQTKVGGLLLNSGGATNGLIVSAGNVGIGVASPSDQLDVNSGARFLTGSNPIRFTSAWSGFPNTATNRAEISNDTGTYKTLMIIGNKSNDGSTRKVSVWDLLQVNGNLYANGYFHNSDERLKQDIQTAPGISLIEKLRGVTFSWKKDGTPSAGVIAQEVEKVMPSAVKLDTSTGMKLVEYDQLIAPLIQAIKEQQDEIDTLKAQVAALKASR